jgi:hypothetical protein
MPEDVATQIHDLEHEYRALVCHLEEAQHGFLESSAGFLASWYWDAVLALVADQQEVTNALPPSTLARLRAEIHLLQAAASTTVDAIVGADPNWWHKQPKDQWYAAAPGTLPEWLIPRFEQAAEQLGGVTRKYGYAEHGPERYALREAVFPPELVAGINEYGNFKRAAELVKRRLDTLKRERSRSEQA